MNDQLRKSLSMPGLLRALNESFGKVKSGGRKTGISIKDCLLSGYAIFSLKYPSLLQFDVSTREDDGLRYNLSHLYDITEIPSDTYMRERLDEVDPAELRPAYKRLLGLAQHGKMLKPFEFMDEHYLLSLDGTGLFSSHTVHCEDCCVKNHKDGAVTYYHQILSAVLVHPDLKVVLPLCPEPIQKQDGARKNDCERNGAKRLIQDFRREHPHLKVIVTEDGLASNAPHIKDLQANKMRFILGAKPGDHAWLFDWVKAAKPKEYIMKKDKLCHRFQYINDVPLNDSNSDVRVNFLEYWEENLKTGKMQHFSWVTDVHLTENNVYQIMRGGRARWKIENETFNTLKNQGYHFEHNFGHGNKHLSTVFAHLMMLAFLIDQLQQLCCPLFQKALKRTKRKILLWAAWRRHCFEHLFDNWDEFLRSLAYGIKKQKPVLNTS